jgi:hypothetical protein
LTEEEAGMNTWAAKHRAAIRQPSPSILGSANMCNFLAMTVAELPR